MLNQLIFKINRCSLAEKLIKLVLRNRLFFNTHIIKFINKSIHSFIVKINKKYIIFPNYITLCKFIIFNSHSYTSFMLSLESKSALKIIRYVLVTVVIKAGIKLTLKGKHSATVLRSLALNFYNEVGIVVMKDSSMKQIYNNSRQSKKIWEYLNELSDTLIKYLLEFFWSKYGSLQYSLLCCINMCLEFECILLKWLIKKMRGNDLITSQECIRYEFENG